MISSLTSSNLFRTVFNNAVSNQFTENSQESLSVDDLVGASVLHELSSKNAPYSLTSSSPYMDQLNFINDAHNADETEKFQHLIRNQKEKISSTLVNEEWIQKPQVQEINSRRTIFDISSSSILSQPSESSFLLKKSFLEQDIENAQNIHSQKASKYKLQDEKAHFQLSSSSSSDFLQNDAISSDIVISKNVTLKTLEKTYGCDMQTDDGLSKSSRIAGVKKSELLSKWQREDASDATAFFLSKREKDPGANVKKSEINFDEKIDKNEENSDAFSENSSVFEMSYKTEGEQNEEGEEGEMPSSKSNKYYKMRQATVKKQVREAKEYFQLFGEWVSKEWGIDEREAAMWEKARRKTMKEEEQNANEIKTGMASEATVEEMRSRLMEAQAEGAEGKEVDELKKEIEKREKKLEKRQKSEELTGLERFWIQEEKKKAEKMRREKSEEGGANEEDKVKFGYWLISEESPFKFTDTFSREWIRSIKNTHSKRGNTTDSDEIHSKFQPETNQQRQKALPYLSSSVQQELPDAPESMTFVSSILNSANEQMNHSLKQQNALPIKNISSFHNSALNSVHPITNTFSQSTSSKEFSQSSLSLCNATPFGSIFQSSQTSSTLDMLSTKKVQTENSSFQIKNNDSLQYSNEVRRKRGEEAENHTNHSLLHSNQFHSPLCQPFTPLLEDILPQPAFLNKTVLNETKPNEKPIQTPSIQKCSFATYTQQNLLFGTKRKEMNLQHQKALPATAHANDNNTQIFFERIERPPIFHDVLFNNKMRNSARDRILSLIKESQTHPVIVVSFCNFHWKSEKFFQNYK